MAGAGYRFAVLGPLVFERDGREVPVPGGRQRSLLALLLADPAPLSRDRLIDELWGEQPPATAVSALHVHLSKLRALLGGLLVLSPAGYSLKADGFELDARQFDALVAQAGWDGASSRSLLAEALGLFRGEPLCDVACEGTVARWRHALEEKRLEAIVLRIDADLVAGLSAELVGELRQLAGENPFEERFWGQLMLALYRSGRQADALDAYQRVRRQFDQQLGLEPSEPLTRLQQQILEQDPGLSQPPATEPAAGAAAAAPASVVSSLPEPVTRLVGRQAELADLRALLADPDVRMVTLTGPGGVGKTRLLVEAARQLEPDYADAAVLVRLEQLTDPALVAAEIAGALARRDGSDGPGADGLASYLRERELLVALDNFEHLLAAAALLGELLAVAPRIRVLISSRTALRIRGEHVFEVDPLVLPARDDHDADVAQSPAVQLFVQCALAANRKLQVDVTMTRTVATVCRALDGLPLAIELAAARSDSLSPAQIAERLARPLLIGEHALRDLPDRQQTLYRTIRWSYDLLSPAARDVLCCAGVFLGGFTLTALGAVSGRRVDAQLDELVDTSLVRRQSGDGRLELLELVRAFALDEAAKSGQGSAARARHRHFFAAHVAPASTAFDAGRPPGEVAARLQADHANIRAALEDAIAARDQDPAVALALGLRSVWFAGMLRRETHEFVDRLLELFTVPGEQELLLLRAAAFLDGFTPGATTWNRRVAARATELGDPEALALATCNLFATATEGLDFDEMTHLRVELLGAITPDTSPRALGTIHYNLALDDYIAGRFDSACEHATLSAEHTRASGYEWMLAAAIGTHLLAESARDGAITQAALAEAFDHVRRLGVPPLAVFGLWLVARYAAGVDPDAAAQWLAHAERIVLAINSPLWPERVLRNETMTVLGLTDLSLLLATVPPLGQTAALDQAAAWLAGRDPTERSPRAKPAQVTPPANSML